MPGRGPRVSSALAARLVLVVMIAAAGQSAAQTGGLSSAEEAWLDAHGPIRVAVDGSFAPYAFFDDSGDVQGINQDFLRLMSVRLGLVFEFVPQASFQETLDAVRSGKADIAMNLNLTPERQSHYLFTSPYARLKTAAWTRTGAQVPEDFAGMRVAVVDRSSIAALVPQRFPAASSVLVPDIRGGLTLVSEGGADAFIGANAPTAYFARELGLYEITPLPEPIDVRDIHIAISTAYPELLPILEKGLASVPAEDRTTIFVKWTGYDQRPEADDASNAAPSWLRPVLLGLGAAVFLGVMWIVLLRGQVARKTRAIRESEARFRASFDDAPTGMVLLDLDGTVRAVNASMLRLTGHDRSAVVGRPWQEFTDPEDRLREADIARRLGKGAQGRYSIEKRLVRSDGSVVWADANVSIVRDGAGEPLQLVVQARDLTERKELEAQRDAVIAQLQHREAKLIEAQHIARIGSWEWDPASARMTWSPELYRLYERDPREFVPTLPGLLSLVPPEERARFEAAIRTAVESRGSFEFEHGVLLGSGGTAIFQAKGGATTDHEGRVKSVRGTCQDVTNERLAQTQAQRQRVTRHLVRRMLQSVTAAGWSSQQARRLLGRDVGHEPVENDMESILASVEDMGLGQLYVGSASEDRFTVQGTDLLEATPGQGRPTCFLVTGLLESALSRVHGRRALATETECQSQGHAMCTFVVKLWPAEPATPRQGTDATMPGA